MINRNHTEEENTKRFNEFMDKLVEKIEDEYVVVTDADETLSEFDTSHIFCDSYLQDKLWLETREKFATIGRNYEGFLEVAKLYSRIDPEEYKKHCQKSSKKVKLHEGWDDFIKRAPVVIVVTSGVKMLWQEIIQNYCWANVHLIGGNRFDLDDFIVDPNAKGIIVQKLLKAKKRVLAFGDSRIDAQMLTGAHMGCLVINERRNPGLPEMLTGLDSIVQLRTKAKPHKNIPIKTFEEIFINFFGGKPDSLLS